MGETHFGEQPAEGGILGLDVPEEPLPLVPEGGPWVCSCAPRQARGHHDGHLCLLTDHFVLNANVPVPNEEGSVLDIH